MVSKCLQYISWDICYFDIFQVVLLRFCSSTTSQAPNLHLATQLPLLLFFFPTPAHIVNAHLAVCCCQRPILKASPVMLKASTFWPSLTIEILAAFKNVENWQTSAIWRSLVLDQVVSVSGTHYENVWYQATSHWYGSTENKQPHLQKKNIDIEDIQKQLQHSWLEPRITTVVFQNSCFLLMAQKSHPISTIQGEYTQNSPISISQLWKDSLGIQLASWYLLVSRLIGVLNQATWKNQRLFPRIDLCQT